MSKEQIVTNKITDKEFERTPTFYKSISGSPFYSRTAYNIDVKLQKPKLSETIQGNVLLLADGSGSSAVHTVIFKKQYNTPPYVEGIAKFSNGNVVKIPHNNAKGDNPKINIDRRTNATLQLTIDGGSGFVGTTVTYKLRVFDLRNNEG